MTPFKCPKEHRFK